MSRKIVLKKLSASDLTLFKCHFDKTSGAKQKAINLDIDPLVTSIYRELPSIANKSPENQIPVAISIYGPGGAGEHLLARKILKQQKNWRLDGEYVLNPDEQPRRYNTLKKGDFAILEFHGDISPKSVRIYLVARSNPPDRLLHEYLRRTFWNRFSARRGMIRVSDVELKTVIDRASVKPGHPVLDLSEMDDLEDAAQGGIEGICKLVKRRKGRPIRYDELQRAKANAERIGRIGEQLYNQYLESRKATGRIRGFKWVSAENAVAPYDFSVEEGRGRRLRDVKATAGDFGNRIHVSLGELLEMRDSQNPYDICRFYNVDETGGKFRLARNVGDKARLILDAFAKLPLGVSVDGVSTPPDLWGFEKKEYSVGSQEAKNFAEA